MPTPSNIASIARASLRSERERRNLTRDELALRAGVSVSQLTKLERGERAMSLEWVEIFADALDVDVSVFISDAPAETDGKYSELLDEIETAYDLLTALDKTGDGIGGDVGHGVSAVALAARSALDNARSMVRAMGGRA